MIEVNLIPDVKFQLLKARSLRVKIISICTLVSLIAGGAVILLSVYVFGVQTVASVFADNATKDEYEKLSKVEDLSKVLTIQDQLGQISSLEDKQVQSSRIFNMLTEVIPSKNNKNYIEYSALKLDTEEHVITIEAEAVNGYEALEVFKKTLNQTKFIYREEGDSETDDPKSISLAVSPITDGDRSYGQNSSNQRVLRFSLSFEYAPELFSTQSRDWKFDGPKKQNATDSANGVPESLFNNGAGN